MAKAHLAFFFVVWHASRCKENSLSLIVLKLCLIATVCYVWKEQNKRRFKNLCQPDVVALNSIKSTIRLQLSSLKIAHFAANGLFTRMEYPHK